MSPELFFSLYSEGNGFTETEVFLADLENDRAWFAVKQPTDGERALVISRSPLYVLCRTRKLSDVSCESVQQSDYVYSWSRTSRVVQSRSEIIERTKRIVKRSPLVHRSLLAVYGKARRSVQAFGNSPSLSNRNRYLRKLSVAKLLAG